jgi:hypothetical protein
MPRRTVAILFSAALAMIYVYKIATAAEFYWLDTVGLLLALGLLVENLRHWQGE